MQHICCDACRLSALTGLTQLSFTLCTASTYRDDYVPLLSALTNLHSLSMHEGAYSFWSRDCIPELSTLLQQLPCLTHLSAPDWRPGMKLLTKLQSLELAAYLPAEGLVELVSLRRLVVTKLLNREGHTLWSFGGELKDLDRRSLREVDITVKRSTQMNHILWPLVAHGVDRLESLESITWRLAVHMKASELQDMQEIVGYHRFLRSVKKLHIFVLVTAEKTMYKCEQRLRDLLCEPRGGVTDFMVEGTHPSRGDIYNSRE